MQNIKYNQLLQTELIHIEEVNHYQKLFIANDVFNILYSAYQNVPGKLHFKNVDDLLDSTDKWQVIYFDTQIIGAIIYKAKKGLKMVALGFCNNISRKIMKIAKYLTGDYLRDSLKYTWMEVSEAAEKFMMKYGGKFYQVSNNNVKKLLGKDIEVCQDGYHYTREIQGIKKTKIVLGNPKVQFNNHYMSN